MAYLLHQRLHEVLEVLHLPALQLARRGVAPHAAQTKGGKQVE
jgi:hypothetical protein